MSAPKDNRIPRISLTIRVILESLNQDITTMLLDPVAFKDTIDLFVERYKDKNISVVVACTLLLDIEKGVWIHGQILERGLECNVFIADGLVDLYCKYGQLVDARKVFDKM
ncbi:pentatricopeptide repeat-containing protein [Tanacetum coccineum]